MSGSDVKLSLPHLSAALVTLAAVVVLELLARGGVALPSAAPLLLLGVAGSAFVGGVVGGMAGVVIAATYLLYLYAEAGGGLRLAQADQMRLAMLLISGAGIVLLATLLKRRHDEASTAARQSPDDATAAAPATTAQFQLNQAMQSLLADVPALVWQVRPPLWHCEFVSGFAAQMLGHTPSQWQEDPLLWQTAIHPDDREMLLRQFEQLLASGQPARIDHRCITRQGRILSTETRATPMHDSGRIVGIRCVTQDITRHRRAQRALRRRAAQLRRLARQLKKSNRDLDQFAYIASHDLRAPLRGIANLSRWIEEDMGDRFTPEAHQQMEMLRGRVHRMEALIDGILQYSRVGRVKIVPERVDLEQLIRDCIDLLDPPPEFSFDIGPDMPVFVAQKLRLQQVVMNLLSNAIKHHTRRSGRLSIRVRDQGGFYEFSFADDGPGIAPEYHGKIFELFQTLIARDKLEATGVGLSLVKRIVEAQGGSVSVESREGQGATFRFTWPKRVSGA